MERIFARTFVEKENVENKIAFFLKIDLYHYCVFLRRTIFRFVEKENDFQMIFRFVEKENDFQMIFRFVVIYMCSNLDTNRETTTISTYLILK